VTHCRRNLVLAAFFSFFIFRFPLQAQRPSDRYRTAMLAGRTEPQVKAFVASCLGTASSLKPLQLYSQGSWFVATDLAAHMKDQGSDDDGTAQVWELSRKPRALSLWVHDDEFDRHTLACLNDQGLVTRLINEYMPGLSEPDLHWIYIHTFTLVANQQYRSSGRYTDWNGHPISPPKLTSEDRDFIAGERQYKRWTDFDFASALARHQP
jgi:hypothetical protein